jgi:tetratricopeptide (TPR) repeat protein
VRALVELGHLEQADAEIAAVSRRTGDPSARRDALTWTTMRALLDGRAAEVTAGLAALRSLATESGDAAALDRYWTQRWWAAVERGDEADRFDVVDHCRERAYRFDDLPWWGALCLSLAGLGRADEAARAFDETLRLLEAPVADEVRLDVVSNLVEAAAVLGYNRRTVAAAAAVDWPDGRLVVTGPAVLCKGSVDRYRGLGLAAAGRPEAAAECFRTAAEVHRAIGAGPLLDRTHRQAERVRRTA